MTKRNRKAAAAVAEPLPQLTPEQHKKLQQDVRATFEEHNRKAALTRALDWLEEKAIAAERLAQDLRRRKAEIAQGRSAFSTRSDYLIWSINEVQNFTRNISYDNAAQAAVALAKAYDDEPKPE